MDTLTLQTFLNSRGAKLEADGKLGAKTLKAAETFIHAPPEWTSDRLLIALEQAYYQSKGIEVGAIDGLVGEQTRQARREFKDKAEGTWRDSEHIHTVDQTKYVAKVSNWPRQRDCATFFGAPGANLTRVQLPFPFRIAWDPAKTITSTMANVRVKVPLEKIWTRTLNHYTLGGIQTLRLDMFGGCFNIRKMRGGTALSMHSFGIAWDIDPERNQLKWNRGRANLDAPVYDKFWSFVEDEGGVSLGRARDFDWMHFQFARL